MRFSYFSHFFSNQPENITLSGWDEFISIMHAISDVEGYKPASDDYENKQALISAGIYEGEDKRTNDNVIGWDILLLDIDDGVESLDHIRGIFNPFNYLMYSSPSCTADHLKLRVCIPLSKFAPRSVLKQIFFGMNAFTNGLVDKQTSDPARIMYQPARYINKGAAYVHVFEVNTGVDLNWEGLITTFPSPPEADRYKEHNKLSGLKKKIYLNTKSAPCMIISARDCPFVYPMMIEHYLLTPAGQHHSAIYKFMVKCCYQAEKIGYPLGIDELVQLAEQLDAMDGGHYKEKKLFDNAKDALEYTGI
jgi:hypothetical protein